MTRTLLSLAMFALLCGVAHADSREQRRGQDPIALLSGSLDSIETALEEPDRLSAQEKWMLKRARGEQSRELVLRMIDRDHVMKLELIYEENSSRQYKEKRYNYGYYGYRNGSRYSRQ